MRSTKETRTSNKLNNKLKSVVKSIGFTIHSYVIFAAVSLILASPFQAVASTNFATTCVAIPSTSLDNYLLTNTAYGYIISNIDMNIYADNACDINNPNFNFCIANASGITPVCQQISMKLGDITTLGAISTNPALGGNNSLKNILLSVTQVNDTTMCLTMPTSRGVQPLACKNTKETSPPEPIPVPSVDCSMAGQACYSSAKSQSLFNMSGVTVECLTQTLENVFYQNNTCSHIEFTALAPFSSFQASLTTAVRTALIIYAIFYGFKILMNNEYVNLDKVSGFIMKFLLVSYFAVGLGPTIFQNGLSTTRNGMVDWALPFMTEAIADFAYMVYSSGGSRGLCQFDMTKYPKGYGYYALFDGIDCRIGYYLGMQLLYNTSTILDGISSSTPASQNSGTPININPTNNGPDTLHKADNFAFFTTMFGFLMSGEIIIVICGIAFAVIFGSIMLQFTTSYLVCLITLYVMAYISPIFITMALFERTKNYFDQWLKVTISCALQPAVLAGFVALLLTLYDTAIYGTCQYQRHDYVLNDNKFSTFELQLPLMNPSECTNTMGYKLLSAYNGNGWGKTIFILFSVDSIGDSVGFVVNMLYMLALSFIFYHFSASFSAFASSITEGPGMEAVTASPQKIVDLVMKAKETMQNMGKNAAKEAKPNTDANKHNAKGGGGGGEASDKSGGGEEGGGEASDKSGGGEEGGGGAAAGGSAGGAAGGAAGAG